LIKKLKVVLAPYMILLTSVARLQVVSFPDLEGGLGMRLGYELPSCSTHHFLGIPWFPGVKVQR